MAVFEQSDKSVRSGSEVLYCYQAGDVDVVRVIKATDLTSQVLVRFPDGREEYVTSAALAPFEDQDFDEDDAYDEDK